MMEQRRIRLASATIVLIASVSFAETDTSRRPETSRLETVLQDLNDSQRLITAWDVEYHSNPYDQNTRYLVRRVASRFPSEYHHWTSHVVGGLSPSDDPIQQRLTLSEKVSINEFPFQRMYFRVSRKSSQPLPGTAGQEMIFIAPGIWTLQAPPPQGRDGSWSVLRAVGESKNYSLSATQEKVAGVWCHVLIFPEHERVFLDVTRPGCLVARERLSPKTGLVEQKFLLLKHSEIKPGIWLPSEVTNVIYHDADGSQSPTSGRSSTESTLFFSCWRVNEDVTDAVFTPNFLPGTVEVDEKTSAIRQVVPGGFDYIDHLVSWITPKISYTIRPVLVTRWTTEIVLECIVSFASIACVAAYLLKHSFLKSYQFEESVDA